MLDERKVKLIELHIKGKNKSAIAREIGISRPTVREWLNDPEVMKEIEDEQKDLIQSSKNRLASNLNDYIDILDNLARTSTDKRTQASCAMYLTDKITGRTPIAGAINESDNNKENIPDDVIEQAIKEMDKENDGLTIVK